MEKIQFSAPCLFGIEGICADELKRMNIDNVKKKTIKVSFLFSLCKIIVGALKKARLVY